jgi:hypothetical protein
LATASTVTVTVINGGLSMTEEIYEKFDGYNWDGDEAFKVSRIIFWMEFIEY